MRVTVLGKSPSWQDAGGACSGYLIEEGDIAVLMDCGNGVFSKLRNHVDYVAAESRICRGFARSGFIGRMPQCVGQRFPARIKANDDRRSLGANGSCQAGG